MGTHRQEVISGTKGTKSLLRVDEEVKQRSLFAETENATKGHSEAEKVAAGRLMQRLIDNEFRCGISGRLLTPDTASLDHTIPLSLGGTHDMSNVDVVHKTINKMKGSMPLDEFVKWCKSVASWVN